MGTELITVSLSSSILTCFILEVFFFRGRPLLFKGLSVTDETLEAVESCDDIENLLLAVLSI
jgi:hypothetical protein